MEVVDVWTGRHASALRVALRMTNEAFARKLPAAVRTVAHWEAKPEVVLSPAMQEVLDALLDQTSDSARKRFALLLGDEQPATLDSTHVPTPRTSEDFMASAYESASDVAFRGGHVSDAVEALQQSVRTTARRYSQRGPIAAFADARQIRNLSYKLIERTHRPSELADVYVAAGASTALMASIAFDLGHWEAARSLADSATRYAEIAGHASLQAWALGLQASLANWRRDFDAARDAFDRGMLVAPAGAPRRRLRYIAARTFSGLGDLASVGQLLAAGEVDREVAEGTRDEMEHELGGEFAFGDARAQACAAAAWLEVREASRAEADALQALAIYEALDEVEQPFSPINGLRIDVAAARSLQSDLDGAREVLRPVLALEPERRNAALTGRMRSVRKQLLTPRWERVGDASDLLDAIDEWIERSRSSSVSAHGSS